MNGLRPVTINSRGATRQFQIGRVHDQACLEVLLRISHKASHETNVWKMPPTIFRFSDYFGIFFQLQ